MSHSADPPLFRLPFELQLYIFTLAATSEHTLCVSRIWFRAPKFKPMKDQQCYEEYLRRGGKPLLKEAPADGDLTLADLSAWGFFNDMKQMECEPEKAYWVIKDSPCYGRPDWCERLQEAEREAEKSSSCAWPKTIPTVSTLSNTCKHVRDIVKDNFVLQKTNQIFFWHHSHLLRFLAEIGPVGRDAMSSIYLTWSDSSDESPHAWRHTINLLRTCHNLRSFTVDLSSVDDWFLNLDLDNSMMKTQLGRELRHMRGLRSFEITFDENTFELWRWAWSRLERERRGEPWQGYDNYFPSKEMLQMIVNEMKDYARELGTVIFAPRSVGLAVTDEEIADALVVLEDPYY
jgi:hypothetical protein